MKRKNISNNKIKDSKIVGKSSNSSNSKIKDSKIVGKSSNSNDLVNLNKKDALNLLKQSYNDIDVLKMEKKIYKQQLEYYERELLNLKENCADADSILFYDYGTIINHNDDWNDVHVSMVRFNEYTEVISKSGKWFEPLKKNNNFFLPSKFRVDLELIEYNPTLKVILLNSNGKVSSTEIGGSENFNAKCNLTIAYYEGNIKIRINDKIINKKADLGNDGIRIRFDMWGGDKLKFKNLIIWGNSIDIQNNKLRFCPICGTFSKFDQWGNSESCPKCKSLERHRFAYLLFKYKFHNILFNQNIKFLHFAPEDCLYDFFNEKRNIDYFPVDLNPENWGVKIRDQVNMESIPYESNTFDMIYHSHVLEHVPNDTVAMNELYRVLKPNGYCVIMVPINFSFNETLEKEEYDTPELREKYYGQYDHLRYYAMDIVNKLESVGFNVEPIFSESLFDFKNEMELYKINHDVAFICKK